jgi:hypothetical protein
MVNFIQQVLPHCPDQCRFPASVGPPGGRRAQTRVETRNDNTLRSFAQQVPCAQSWS